MLQETVTFPATTKAEWEALLLKELKGAPIETLLKTDEVEELSFSSFQHRSDAHIQYSDPGLAPFTRGGKSTTNEWLIGKAFYWRNHTNAADLNKEILSQLMRGTTAITIIAECETAIPFGTVLNEVGLEYVHTSLKAVTVSQAEEFIAFLGNHPGAVEIANGEQLKSAQSCKTITVNGYAVQQAGGTSWQEIAIALAEGHDVLVKLLDSGVSVDDALSRFSVVLGVGTRYFSEVAKFRAFRMCWANMIAAYLPQNEAAKLPHITVKTGFTHISLKDPYTNLLRQTTQAMSAIIGGADELIVQPYDAYSSNPNPEFTQRMATNISLLLQEESYLSYVIDAAGGAYAFDSLTNAIAEKAWNLFREIEQGGGITNHDVHANLSAAILVKARLRTERIQLKKDKLIGVNVFPNPTTEIAEWMKVPTAWNGLPTLILEQAV